MKGSPGLLTRAPGFEGGLCGVTVLHGEGVVVTSFRIVVWAVLVGFLLSDSGLCIISPSIAPAVSLM